MKTANCKSENVFTCSAMAQATKTRLPFCADLEGKLKKNQQLRITFRRFLTEVAKAAENSKTGRHITCSAMAQATKARPSSVRANLEEQLKESQELRSTFRHFLAEMAKATENSKSGDLFIA